MGKYERQPIPVAALEVGNSFEHPFLDDVVCSVEHHSLVEDTHIIGYTITEGHLHWPVVYLPVDFEVILLLPTTTYVKLSGKEWVDSLTEHHGVSGDQEEKR